MMAEERYFHNHFAEYSETSSKEVLDPSTHKLTEEFHCRLLNSVSDQIKVLERGLVSELNWSDTSVYTGVSGYTYLYIHLADNLGEEQWFQKAVGLADKSVNKLKGKRVTFLCGDAGPLSIAAVIYDRVNNKEALQSCLDSLIKMKTEVLDVRSDIPDELLYGRVGYLYALMFVRQRIDDHGISDEVIRSVIEAILRSGKQLSKRGKHRSPLMYKWHDKQYLGAAHGIVGILVVLLQAREHLTDCELNELIKPTIEWMITLCFSSGNLPSSLNNNSDRLVHWCHGAPGGIFLFTLAFKVFGDAKFLDQAKKCADVIWKCGLLKKGYGLCHGSAGNGYGLLYLYQITREVSYLYQAIQFGNWCIDYGKHGCNIPDRPLSLFEGLAGNIFFLSDLLHHEKAKFPAFIL